MNKPTVTIGIPAYNEGENIRNLLSDILRQSCHGFTLKEIIVSSDGSTDRTNKIVRSFNHKIIHLIDNKKRQGIAVRLNQIMGQASSQILVILNADITIKDGYFLKKLIQPIVTDNIDLVSCPIKELPPRNFLEKVLVHSMDMKRNIFEHHNNGHNVYTCFGPARAFSRKLYKKIYFPESIGEDAYSYLYCVFNGYKYMYVRDTQVYYRLPDNFIDHQKQSARFFYSKGKFASTFGEAFIRSHYFLPLNAVVAEFSRSFVKSPLKTMLYGLIFIFIKIIFFFNNTSQSLWEVSRSSKNLKVLRI